MSAILRCLVSAVLILPTVGAARRNTMTSRTSASSPMVLSRYDFSATAATPLLEMPQKLRELSGLAVLPDGSWLAHNDEEGVIYRRATAGGAWAPFIRFHGPDARGDFEAVTLHRGRLWLQRRDGVRRGRRLAAAFTAEADGEDVRQAHNASCEVESLLVARGQWMAPCKKQKHGKGVLVLQQSLSGGDWREAWQIPAHALKRAGLSAELNISDAIVDASSGHWIMVAGPQHTLIEVTERGELIAAVRLPAGRLPQAEALAMLADGTLLVGSEGSGRRPAVIAQYRTRR